MSTLKIGPAPLPGPDPRVASSGGLRLGLGALDHARPAGGSADLDLPRLHRLGHLALQVDLEKPVVQAGAADLDVVGELEAVLEGALRDAAVQVLDVLLGLLIWPFTVNMFSCVTSSRSFSPKPATAIAIR